MLIEILRYAWRMHLNSSLQPLYNGTVMILNFVTFLIEFELEGSQEILHSFFEQFNIYT